LPAMRRFLEVQLLRQMRVYCDTRCRLSVSGMPNPVVVHRLMRINRTSRRVPILSAMGIFLLACAVFGWGLQYKISLYDQANGQSASIPHAKLLSERERPASSFDGASISPSSTQPQSSAFYPLFLIVTLMLGARLSADVWMRDSRVVDAITRQRRAHSNFFSFRPPPAPLPSY
jgi:hypothetical protein